MDGMYVGYEKKERLEDDLKAQVSPCVHLKRCTL